MIACSLIIHANWYDLSSNEIQLIDFSVIFDQIVCILY